MSPLKEVLEARWRWQRRAGLGCSAPSWGGGRAGNPVKLPEKESLMNIYYVPGTELGARDKTVNKLVIGPALWTCFPVGKENTKQTVA